MIQGDLGKLAEPAAGSALPGNDGCEVQLYQGFSS